jgi:hypothetical protein
MVKWNRWLKIVNERSLMQYFAHICIYEVDVKPFKMMEV